MLLKKNLHTFFFLVTLILLASSWKPEKKPIGYKLEIVKTISNVDAQEVLKGINKCMIHFTLKDTIQNISDAYPLFTYLILSTYKNDENIDVLGEGAAIGYAKKKYLPFLDSTFNIACSNSHSKLITHSLLPSFKASIEEKAGNARIMNYFYVTPVIVVR